MNAEKFDLLLNGLINKTQKGELDWKPLEQGDTFTAFLEGSSVSIENVLNSGFIIYLRKKNNELIDAVTLFEDAAEFDKTNRLFKLIEDNVVVDNKEIDRILEQLAV